MNDELAITMDGRAVTASSADSIASAVMNAQGLVLRQSVTGEPRGPVCGMGVCFECRVSIDGIAHQRSCQTPCQAGMTIETCRDTTSFLSETSPSKRIEQSFDVVVIGAGPAGIAAACTAAESGRRVAIIDDNPDAGGQIWRRDALKASTGSAANWLARLRKLPVVRFTQTQIIGALAPQTLLAGGPSGTRALKWERLILASGARERFVAFPGWTLPGVFGAGGLQALVKSGYRIAGRKVVIAGSGPLLLPVAAYLRKRGADVRMIAEQSPRGKLMRFAGSLMWHQPSKIVEALSLGWQIRGMPYRTACWPVRADGHDRLESVTLTDGTRTWVEPCDALACGFGLVANLELAMLLGCEVRNRFVAVDAQQRTTVANIHAVGELTGIGGVDKALLEGQIAGWCAAGQAERALGPQSKRDRTMQFVALLDDAFALREELKHLAAASTIVCRCEDVRLGALLRYNNWRDAKLQTRCGMGPCQGRTCGPIVQQLFGWDNDSVRPPLIATSLGNLAE